MDSLRPCGVWENAIKVHFYSIGMMRLNWLIVTAHQLALFFNMSSKINLFKFSQYAHDTSHRHTSCKPLSSWLQYHVAR